METMEPAYSAGVLLTIAALAVAVLLVLIISPRMHLCGVLIGGVFGTAGATGPPHGGDSGFWLVSRFFGMDVKTTLKTWTVIETTLGLVVFAIACLLWVVF
ncbi:hypothetical protein BH23ACT6_BH23ACT6_12400 [soil metagenome]